MFLQLYISVSCFVYYILLVFYLYFLCNIVTLCECHGEIKGYLLTYLLNYGCCRCRDDGVVGSCISHPALLLHPGRCASSRDHHGRHRHDQLHDGQTPLDHQQYVASLLLQL